MSIHAGSDVSTHATTDMRETKAKTHYVRRGNLETLRRWLGLSPKHQESAQIHDLVFVAINFAGRNAREIGISVLDTRDLDQACQRHADVISTRHIHVMERSHRLERHIARRTNFVFGRIERVHESEVEKLLLDVFYIVDQELSSPEATVYRHIAILGHALDDDLLHMYMLGLPLKALTPVIARYDTQHLAYESSGGPPEYPSLKKLVHALGLTSRNLDQAGAQPRNAVSYNAGNDAAYTLQAALILATRGHPSDVDAKNLGWIKLCRLSATKALQIACHRMEQEKQAAHADALRHYARVNFLDCDGFVVRKQDLEIYTECSMGTDLLLATVWTKMGCDASRNQLSILAWDIMGYEAFRAVLAVMPIYYCLTPTRFLDYLNGRDSNPAAVGLPPLIQDGQQSLERRTHSQHLMPSQGISKDASRSDTSMFDYVFRGMVDDDDHREIS